MSKTEYSNPETAEQLRDEVKRREEQNRQKTAEHLSTKQRLQQKRDRKRKTVDVMDEPVEFYEPGMGMQKKALDIAVKYQGMAEDDLGLEETRELMDFMTSALTELSVDDSLDEDFWNGFGFEDLEHAFEDVIMEVADVEDLDPGRREEIDRFLGE